MKEFKPGKVDQIIGIDPGLNGAIVVLRKHEEEFVYYSSYPMPKKKRSIYSGKKLKNRTFLDGPKLFEILSAIVQSCPDFGETLVAYEKIASFGGASNATAFSGFGFGRVIGATELAIDMLGCPTSALPPITWKRILGLGGDKKEAVAVAEARFGRRIPGRADFSEAALIAYVGLLDWNHGLTADRRAQIIYELVLEHGPIGTTELRDMLGDWAQKESAWNNAVARYRNLPKASGKRVRGWKEAQFWIRGKQAKPTKRTPLYDRLARFRYVLRQADGPMSTQELKDAIGDDWVNKPHQWSPVVAKAKQSEDIITRPGSRTTIYEMEAAQ